MRLALPTIATMACLMGAAIDASAQNRRTVLSVTGLPLSVVSTPAADFDAGSVSLGSFTFNVDLTTNAGGAFPTRVTTVAIACGTPCPASGTLPVGSLQWRRADLGAWNTLTTGFVDVETRTATFNGTNDPWSNSVFFRYLVSWTGSPPTAATQFRLNLQLTVAAP